MAAKSTLNSKLGRVSEIRFCTAAGKNMSSRLYTQEDASFTVKVGCKQPSKAVDNYQVQYRVRSRFTPANAKAKGADWTKWSAWKNMVAFGSGSSKVPLGSAKDPDTWLRSNKGVSKKSSYITFYSFKGVKVNGKYDARQYQVRVRTYNAKTRKHGAWATQTLSVYKAAVVANETIHRGGSGRLTFDCNYIWGRGGTVHVDSIVDSTGRELLHAKVSRAMKYDSQRQKAVKPTPAYRSGYTPGEFDITVGSGGLKRAISYGERLTWKAYYQTKDGAKTYFKSPIKVSSQDITIDKPRVTAATDKAHGWLAVRAYKTDADDIIERASCVVSYVFRGKAYTVKPSSASLNLTAQSTKSEIGKWTFRDLPLGIDLSVKVSVGNGYHSSRTVKSTVRLAIDAFILTAKSGSRTAALSGNAELRVRSSAKATVGLPHGRKKPFASFMAGTQKTISLSGGVADEVAGKSRTPSAAKIANWESISSNPGIYLVRAPDGRMYKAAVTEVGISQSRRGVAQIDVTATEVG